ncbi:MAG: SH3 domain-containing protein [Burkholderiales bacterium]|nr:SH3 domain-containing protein [Burkholderiales bacterium]
MLHPAGKFFSKWLVARLIAAWFTVAINATAFAEPVTLERDSVLRAEPRTDAGAVGNLAKGESGEAVARQGAWVQVKSGALIGWLYSFNIRFGTATGAGDSAGAGSVLGRVFGPRQRVNVTATIGIRGLDAEDLQQARFDGGQLQALDGFAATPEASAAHAGDAGLSASRIEYLAESAADSGSGTSGSNP